MFDHCLDDPRCRPNEVKVGKGYPYDQLQVKILG